jgi:DNA repair exonuclease SbcCD ATPase subunit
VKIVKLQAENVKRLVCVEIEPNGNLIVVGGKNGNGKTSLLDSIMMALAGKSAIPSKPVREGEDHATITVEMDEDFVVTRMIKPDGESKVEVRSKTGAKYPSPQALLDGFAARFTFDPLAFKSMKPKDQVELMKSVLGLDFTAIDSERASLYSDRTAVNRQIRDAEGALARLPKHDDAPAQEIATPDITQEVTLAQRAAGTRATIEQTIAQGDRDRGTANQKIADLRAEIEARRASIGRLEQTIANWDSLERPQHVSDLAKVEVCDVSALRAEVDRIAEANRKVRDNQQHGKAAAQIKLLSMREGQLTAKINAIDKSKADQLSAAKFPIPGLSFGNDNVIFNGIPFEQLGGAEQLRVSTCIGIELHPKLKIMLLRSGGDLDEDNLKLLGQLAEERDQQIWLERPGTGSEITIVMEDGSVKEKPTAPTKKLPAVPRKAD